MDDLSTLALIAAAAGMAYSLGHALVTVRRRFAPKDAQEMVLQVDGETITIDVADIEHEDAGKIERAVESVRAAKERDRDLVAA